jgi:hypothetical protein
VTKHPLADIRFDALTQRIAVLEEWKSRCEQGDRDYEDWLQSMSKKMPPDPKKVEQDTYLGKAVTLGQYKEAWKFLAETSSGPCMCHYVRPEKCPRCRANRLLGKLRGVK